MPESLLGTPGRTDARTLAEYGDEFRRSPPLQQAVESLSKWFRVLRTARYEAAYADARLKAAFADAEDNPVAWCSASLAYLPPMMENSLSVVIGKSGVVEHLPPFVRYLLGRASMRCMIGMPSGSAGLALAYGLIWPLTHDGVSAAGADDELAERLADFPEALAEVKDQARRLEETAVAKAFDFERDRVSHSIRQAAEPTSLEACSHWQIGQLPLNLDFGRVVQVVGSNDISAAVNLLELIGNPALVAAVLGRFETLSVREKSDLLRSLDPIFGDDGRWTQRTAAWMVLLDLEARLSATLEEQNGTVRLGGSRPSIPESVIQDGLESVIEALLSRPDGRRLALEWLAHLLWAVLLSRAQRAVPGEEDFSAFEPRRVLLKAVSSSLAREEWARPVRVWGLFGGSRLVMDIDRNHTPIQDLPLVLPVWRDWLGQANTLIPIAVAVQLWEDTSSSPGWLVPWVRSVCRKLEANSATRQLAEASPSQAAGYLAWPLVHSGQPSERFGELWADANWQLTRARFSPLEEAADRARPCVALIRVGLCMLEWAKLAQTAGNIEALASSLADAIDQVRYTLPELGVAEWSALSGSLVGAMAANGLLKEGGCERLLARYQGDDGSLAAAAVNAVANSVPHHEVHQALASLGEDAGELAERWARWNNQFAKDGAGHPSEFLSHLLAISSQGAVTP